MGFIELRGSTDTTKGGRHYIAYKFINGKWLQFNDNNVTVVELRGGFKTLFVLYRRVSSTSGTYLKLEFNNFNYQTRNIKVFNANVKKPFAPPTRTPKQKSKTPGGSTKGKGKTKLHDINPDITSTTTPDKTPSGQKSCPPKKAAAPNKRPSSKGSPKASIKMEKKDPTPAKTPSGSKPSAPKKPGVPDKTPSGKKASAPKKPAAPLKSPSSKATPKPCSDPTPDKTPSGPKPSAPNKSGPPDKTPSSKGTGAPLRKQGIGPLTKRKRHEQFLLDLSKIKKEHETRHKQEDIVTIDLTDSPEPKIKASSSKKDKVIVRTLSNQQITELSKGNHTYIYYSFIQHYHVFIKYFIS